MYKVEDKTRKCIYLVTASSGVEAIQKVQNDQWTEQLDDANVTDRSNLEVTEISTVHEIA